MHTLYLVSAPLSAIQAHCQCLHVGCNGEEGCKEEAKPIPTRNGAPELPMGFEWATLEDGVAPAPRDDRERVLATCQVNGCNGRVVTPNNERVGLCDVHARGGCIFLQRFPEARGSFAEPGWYPVGYCTHRGHTRWLGAYKVDPMTGKLQSTCCTCLKTKQKLRKKKRERDSGGGDGGSGGGGIGRANNNNSSSNGSQEPRPGPLSGGNVDGSRTPSTEEDSEHPPKRRRYGHSEQQQQQQQQQQQLQQVPAQILAAPPATPSSVPPPLLPLPLPLPLLPLGFSPAAPSAPAIRARGSADGGLAAAFVPVSPRVSPWSGIGGRGGLGGGGGLSADGVGKLDQKALYALNANATGAAAALAPAAAAPAHPAPPPPSADTCDLGDFSLSGIDDGFDAGDFDPLLTLLLQQKVPEDAGRARGAAATQDLAFACEGMDGWLAEDPPESKSALAVAAAAISAAAPAAAA